MFELKVIIVVLFRSYQIQRRAYVEQNVILIFLNIYLKRNLNKLSFKKIPLINN